MRIIALRVADIGRFSDPVAVEGFAGGLTVFTGDNEVGKSTLFRALSAAFRLAYTSKDRAIGALQPYDGGAPLIEVDFAVAGKSWRLRKRFLQRPSAELVDLDTGAVVARNADVQPQLDTLRAGPNGLERFGLLWVAQGDSLKDFAIAPDSFASLRQIIQQEVEGAAVDEQARRVHASVSQRLGELVTPKTGKSRGPLAEAEAEFARAGARHEEARTRLAAAEERLAKLAAAAAEADRLRNPVARAAHQTAIAEADGALRKFGQDRNLARAAIDLLRTAESEAETARLNHKTWHETLARAATATAEEARLANALSMARTERQSATTREEELEAQSRALAEARAALEATIAAARAAEEHTARVRQRDELAERLASVRALDAELKSAMAAIAESRVDDGAVKRLQALAATRDRLEQRLAAAAPEVAIAPVPGADRPIALDGKPLTGGATVRVRRPLDISIDGIARITVRPGGGDDAATAEADLARAERTIQASLAELGVADLAAAERAAEARRQHERRRDETRARLSVTAPDGVEPLVAAHARLVAAIAADGPVTATAVAPLATLQNELAALAAQMRASEPVLAEARSAHEALKRNELKIDTLLSATRQRLAELAEALGPAAARVDKTTLLDNAHAATERKRADAVRDASVWRETLQGEDRLQVLERRLADARSADAADTGRLRQLELDIRGWEAGLAADSDADIEHEAEAAVVAENSAISRLAQLRQEVAALRKLDAMLTIELEAERKGIAAPVAERIAPYLDMVLPGASLRMDEGLSPSGIVRATRAEPLDRVSRGTAEQIAVIARLGLARLLADRGAPAPLVLDDALVYADDRRIAALFAVLTEAARHHQVIVLTCRERTFEGLPGERVRLVPWPNAH